MRKISFLVLLAILANLVLGALALPAFAESPVEGQSCNRVGEKSGGLICSRMCGNVWTVPGRCPRGSAPATTVTAQDFAPTAVINDTAKSIVYTVRRGDTLYSIARSHGTTAAAIKQANGLSGNTIWAGQKLTIPLLVAGVAALVEPTPIGELLVLTAIAGGAAVVQMGLHHQESQRVIDSVLAACRRSDQIYQKGDGRSNGSVQLWAGVDPSSLTATVGGVHIVGSYVNFFALRVPVQIGPGAGLQRLGQSMYYYNPKNVSWSAAWRMSKEIGHNPQPESQWLTVGEGLQKWEETKLLYNLNIPIAVIYLP